MVKVSGKDSEVPSKEEVEEVLGKNNKDKKKVGSELKEDISMRAKQADDKFKDTIEIPVGKWFIKSRENPWIMASIVLGLLFIGVLIFGRGNIGTNVASESSVSAGVLAFLNSQVDGGGVTLNSIENKGTYYELLVTYQGNEIPIYVTLDGKNIIADLVPLSGDATNSGSSGTGNTGGASDRVDGISIPKDAPVLGNANAPITIVEFSDFQCPFCRQFYTETLEQIKQNYIGTDKAKLVYMDFPLSFHPSSIPAARAARCAREIGGNAAYWKMHDKMFDEQNIRDGGTVQSTVTFTVDDIKKWAKEIGYNIDLCLDSNKYADEVNADLNYGTTLGVSGTPGFFIGNNDNGFAVVSGAQPYSAFQQVIEAELAR